MIKVFLLSWDKKWSAKDATSYTSGPEGTNIHEQHWNCKQELNTTNTREQSQHEPVND